MKTFLLFILLCLPAIADVGFLQIYNQLDTSVTPYSNKKVLTGKVNAKSQSSVLMLKPGKYTLNFNIDNQKPKFTTVTVSTGETAILCLLNSYSEQKQKAIVSTVTIDPQKDENLLLVRSLIKKSQTLKILDQELLLTHDKTILFKTWNGQPFNLLIDDNNLGVVKPEEKVPHTLLLWSPAPDEIVHLMIPHFQIIVPENLKDDLTFGRERDEIKGLKTLQPKS